MDGDIANADDPSMIATPPQIKAARALLGWSPIDLAQRMEVSKSTVSRLEDNDGPSSVKSLKLATEVLSAAGIIFLERDQVAGDGVRLASPRAASIAQPDERQ
jgi:transcriptional regulator with XRE-family HTH domain